MAPVEFVIRSLFYVRDIRFRLLRIAGVVLDVDFPFFGDMLKFR